MGIIQNLRNALLSDGEEKQRTAGDFQNVVGEAGTTNYGGYIQEDFNPALQGEQAVEIYDKMRKSDATVHATLQAIKLPILSTERMIESADEEDQRQNDIAEFIRMNLFERMDFEAFLRQVLTYKDFGFAYFEKVYEAVDGKVVISKLAPRQQTAHSKWEISGGALGVTQQLPSPKGETSRPEIPMWKLLLFTNDREGDNYEGVSVLRSAYKPWFIKDKLERIDAITHERGAGILDIAIPENSTDQDRADAKELGRNFKIGDQSYVVRQTGWEVGLISDGIASQSTSRLESIRHHDRMIAKNILAMFLSLGDNGSGSYALSKDQSDFFVLGLRATTDYISGVINRELIPELVKLNFGEQEHYPKLKFARVGEIDYREMSETLERLINVGLVEVTPQLKVWGSKTFGLPEVTMEDLEDEIGEDVEPQEAPEELSEQKLSEVKKKFSRPLTFAEGRVAFEEIDGEFDNLEGKAKTTLSEATAEQIERLSDKVRVAVKNGDVKALDKLTIPLTPALRAELRAQAKESFEKGKSTAAKEMDQSIPTTPGVQNKVRDARVEQQLETRNQRMLDIAKSTALTGIAAGLSGIAVANNVRDRLTDKADGLNTQISGKIIVDSLNQGRKVVFERYNKDIHAIQRSEILDAKTCAMCLSIDGRVVDKGDNFVNLGQVHTHCRGLWVPILNSDEELPKAKPIPQSIANRFDTVSGVPVVNEFKQLNKPVINKTSRVQQKVDDGTIENPNL